MVRGVIYMCRVAEKKLFIAGALLFSFAFMLYTAFIFFDTIRMILQKTGTIDSKQGKKSNLLTTDSKKGKYERFLENFQGYSILFFLPFNVRRTISIEK